MSDIACICGSMDGRHYAGCPLLPNTEITALRAEVERLKATLATEQACGEFYRTEIGKLRAENERLRTALEEAARVARSKEDEWTTAWRKGLKADSHLEGKADGAGEVADAIMALIPAKTDSDAS